MAITGSPCMFYMANTTHTFIYNASGDCISESENDDTGRPEH